MIGNKFCHAKKCVRIISTVSEPINLLLDILLGDFWESYQKRNQPVHREGAFYAFSVTGPLGTSIYVRVEMATKVHSKAKIMSQPEADLPFILFIASRKKSFG